MPRKQPELLNCTGVFYLKTDSCPCCTSHRFYQCSRDNFLPAVDHFRVEAGFLLRDDPAATSVTLTCFGFIKETFERCYLDANGCDVCTYYREDVDLES